MEHDDVVDTVQELGAEVLLQLVVDLELHPLVVRSGAFTRGEAEADCLRDVRGTEVRGEDQHGVLEVDRASLAVGETAVFEHLQEGVVDLLVCLLDLVEQHDGERLAADLLGELATLFVADVSGRSTEQTRRGEAVVELAHVDLDERIVLAEEEVRECFRQLGLTDTGRAGEDERARRALRVLQTCTGTTDRLGDGLDCLDLADDPLVQLVFHAEQTRGLFLGELEDGDAGPVSEDLGDLLVVDLGDDVEVTGTPLLLPLGTLTDEGLLLVAQVRSLLEVLCVDGRFLLPACVGDLVVELTQVWRRGHPADAHPRARLVDEVDCLVGQEPIVDVPVGQSGGSNECTVGDRDAVVCLVAIAQTLEDLDGVLDGRLADLDGLETTLESGVLLDVLAVLVEGGGTDGLQFATSQLRLENRRCVDGTFGGTCADERVQLVDEQDDVAAGVDLLEHLLQALLEVTAVTAAGHERAEVEGVELLVLERLGNLAVDDGLSQAFDDCGLTDTGLADENRVVLGTTRQHLHDALDFLRATDDRVELAFERGLGEVASELVENQ
ncbi:hypothetical protein VF34_02190 [Rhodococcus sp. PML026]|nr:hypothetical protein VF34_02190 [Rhodococcus sp. PML026]